MILRAESVRQSLPRNHPYDLFPPLAPYSTGFLKVDSVHTIYWEQSGNPDGVPVVLLHGGPGAGATPTHRRFFDPEHYRIVIYDQRGAGRSHPLGELRSNTTELLVADMEALRRHLGITQWHVFGGSWGSTLALLYATQYPERCLSLILRGIFLNEKSENDWFLNGMKNIFPEAWEQFVSIIPEGERGDLLDAYYARLTGTDEEKKIEAGVQWSLYESACSSLLANYETVTTEDQKQHAVALARIEAHYFKHEAILPEKSLLGRIDAIRSIPSVIIHGRYDVICPIATAHKLHQAWPEADYVIVPDAGHSALDPPLRSRLVEATENFKRIKL